jgi:hypothetical protein
MADELPPAPSESADEAAKAETIRITLPAKPEMPTAKRETVRINLPGKAPLSGVTPKKETTKIVTETGLAPASEASATPVLPIPSPGAAKPVLPPPRPPGATGAPPPPAKPLSGINPPPKPPGLSKPGIPLKPGPPPAAPKPGGPPSASGIRPPAATSVPAAPTVPPSPASAAQKAAAPKKETARITLPPEAAKGALPKATVKMQQTQPLVRQPSASTIQAAPVIKSAPASISPATAAPSSDGLLNVLAIMAFIVSAGAAVLAFFAYSSAQLT